MANIIDEFLVLFGVDPKPAVEGSKVVYESFKQLSSNSIEVTKVVEREGKRTSESFRLQGQEAEKYAQQFKKAQDKIKEEAEKTATALKEKGKEAGEFFTGLIGKAAALFAVFGGAIQIKSFIQDQVKAGSAARRLAEDIKMPVEQLEAFEALGKRFGGTSEGVAESIRGIGEKATVVGTNLPRAAAAAKLFASVGLSEVQIKGKSTAEVLMKLSDSVKGMGQLAAHARLGRLGLDEATVRILRLGGEELAKLIEKEKQFGVATAEDLAEFKEIAQATHDMEDSSRGLGLALLRDLAPAIKFVERMIVGVLNFMRTHSTLTKVVLTSLAVGIGTIGIAAAVAFVPVAALTSSIAVMGYWAVGITAAVFGLYYAFKYLWGLFAGSERGKAFIESWHTGIQIIRSAFASLMTALQPFFELLKVGFQFIKATFLDVFYSITDYISHWIDMVVNYFKLLWALITFDKEGVKEAWKGIVEAIAYQIDWLKGAVLYYYYQMQFTLLDAWEYLFKALKKPAVDLFEWIEKKFISIGSFIGKLAQQMSAANTMGPMGLGELSPAFAVGAGGPGGGSVANTKVSGDTSIKIDSVNIVTPATDAAGIAATIPSAIKQDLGWVNQGDGGYH